jgi:cytochrome b
MTAVQSFTRVRIWDLPTRLFHWSLTVCFVGLLLTGTLGGEAMVFHFRFGYSVLALLLFRFVWGFLGGRWSRFNSFWFSPKVSLAYFKRPPPPHVMAGHSPLAAMSIFALLFFLSMQIASGLVSDDEISFAGPLTHLVSNATVSLATQYHTELGRWILLALVGLHLCALLFYTRRKHQLVSAMIHGDKLLTTASPSSRDDARSRWLALVIFAFCVAVVYGVASLRLTVF